MCEAGYTVHYCRYPNRTWHVHARVICKDGKTGLLKHRSLRPNSVIQCKSSEDGGQETTYTANVTSRAKKATRKHRNCYNNESLSASWAERQTCRSDQSRNFTSWQLEDNKGVFKAKFDESVFTDAKSAELRNWEHNSVSSIVENNAIKRKVHSGSSRWRS